VEVLPAAGITPDYSRSSRDVDVEGLECIVDYGNGISWAGTLSEARRELDCWSDNESNKSHCCDDLAYPVLRKRGLRPVKGAASIAIFVLA
jgi:hypothetical protein